MSVPYAEVIGDPVTHSKSPTIHRFWLDRLGIAGDYRARPLAAEGLADYLAERRHDPAWRGCNVTMPHKETVMPLLARIEPLARQVGAVNTVVKAKDGALVGRNTDVAGFLEPLRPRLAENHYFRMARVLGTGGAALLAVENAPAGRRGRYGMVPQLGAPIGFVAANGLFLLLDLVMTPAEFLACLLYTSPSPRD